MTTDQRPVVVIGAGPAGLTAAYQLTRAGRQVVVLEADDVVGGISRTVERDGWRFDIGGHRFFTKVPAVQALWHEILPPEDFLLRPRMSRIYYDGKYYDYPLRALNALRNLGPAEAARCVASAMWVQVRPPRHLDTFEGWTASRFGWRLYRKFFKTYTEKLWGVPATAIRADWAAQRIKSLSLGKAVVNSLLPKRNQTAITSLIEQFHYPRHGPGMMWERCRDLVVAAGGDVRLRARVTEIEIGATAECPVAVTYHDAGHGRPVRIETDHVISSMPLSELVGVCTPAPPPHVLEAAEDLGYRDFLTVALVVPASRSFPDNWIYIHYPGVKVGRIQNFGSWSPEMVKEGWTCLGLEYFVFEGDEMWDAPDDELVALATKELLELGMVEPGDVEAGYVARMPKAYPVYAEGYEAAVETIRRWIDAHVPFVHPVGRNGMHRYNNQDHSMYTAMLTVENIVAGTAHDIWSVNVEEEYHEEHSAPADARRRTEPGPRSTTGRAAPVLPRARPEPVAVAGSLVSSMLREPAPQAMDNGATRPTVAT